MTRSPLSAKPRKPSKCQVCRSPYQKLSMTHKLCGSVDCGIKFAERSRDKRLRIAAKAERQETRERKEKIKTRSDYMKAAQFSFNRYVRLRAIRFGHACISSGAPLMADGVGGGFDCGHYRSIGSAPHLRFNMNNAWGQSKQDNRYGAGASFEYRRGLIERRGLDVVEALEANNGERKFTVEYLVRLRKIFDKKAKRIASYV